jgi:sugar (pentulose or hexulose) kinase
VDVVVGLDVGTSRIKALAVALAAEGASLRSSATPWLRERAGRRCGAGRWLGVPEWIVYRLGGVLLPERSLGSRTGSVGIDARGWLVDLAEWSVFPCMAEVAAAATLDRLCGPAARVVGAGGWLRSDPLRVLKAAAVPGFEPAATPAAAGAGAALLAGMVAGVVPAGDLDVLRAWTASVS